MRIGNKIFSYPVLNNSSTLSDYNETSKFSLNFISGEENKPIRNGNKIVFKDLKINIENEGLLQLFNNGKAKAAFIIECSSSTYRKTFPISVEPYDLEVELGNFSGKTIVSAFLYATEDINDFTNSDFIDIFEGRKFEIDKFDILAIDDGFDVPIEINQNEDDKVSSIFNVAPDYGSEGIMKTVDSRRKITIYLPIDQHNAYCTFKDTRQYNNIAFATMAIPALQECLSKLPTADDIEDLYEEHGWLKSVSNSYKKETGNDLTTDVIVSSPLEIAQIVLNYGICNSISDLKTIILPGRTGDSDDE